MKVSWEIANMLIENDPHFAESWKKNAAYRGIGEKEAELMRQKGPDSWTFADYVCQYFDIDIVE